MKEDHITELKNKLANAEYRIDSMSYTMTADKMKITELQNELNLEKAKVFVLMEQLKIEHEKKCHGKTINAC